MPRRQVDTGDGARFRVDRNDGREKEMSELVLTDSEIVLSFLVLLGVAVVSFRFTRR